MTHRGNAFGKRGGTASLAVRLFGAESARPQVLPFLLCSLITVALALWILAAPLAVAGLLLKGAAALAWMRGSTSRAKGRLGLAIVVDCCAVLAWGGHLFTSPKPAMIGVIGILLAGLAFSRLLRWETLERHQWGVQQHLRRSEREEPEPDEPEPEPEGSVAGGSHPAAGDYWVSNSRQ